VRRIRAGATEGHRQRRMDGEAVRIMHDHGTQRRPIGGH
jgi:hypothetical protein